MYEFKMHEFTSSDHPPHSDSEHVGFLILVPIILFPSCPHASIRVILPAQIEEN
jgi:hypothetical protein